MPATRVGHVSTRIRSRGHVEKLSGAKQEVQEPSSVHRADAGVYTFSVRRRSPRTLRAPCPAPCPCRPHATYCNAQRARQRGHRPPRSRRRRRIHRPQCSSSMLRCGGRRPSQGPRVVRRQQRRCGYERASYWLLHLPHIAIGAHPRSSGPLAAAPPRHVHVPDWRRRLLPPLIHCCLFLGMGRVSRTMVAVGGCRARPRQSDHGRMG